MNVERGQVFGLLGGRGTGKSTVIRLLSTLLKPDTGTAKVNGFDLIEEEHKVRESIGVAFEETGLYGRLTVRENLNFSAALHRLKSQEPYERVNELLQVFNLVKEADQATSTLSESQKKRLLVACAAVHEPPLLLIDISTSELDMITARLIGSFITGYCEGDRTVIKTTRNLVEARLLCRKMAIIRNGFLVASGTLSEIEQTSTESGLREALTELDVVGA